MPAGRPTLLTSELIEKAREYIEKAIDEIEVLGDNRPTVLQKVNIPTVEGLANYLGCHKDSLYEWEKTSDEFSDVLTRVRNIQAERLINKGLGGQYNPAIAKLLLSKHGYVEKTEQDQTIKGDVTFLNDVPRPKN